MNDTKKTQRKGDSIPRGFDAWLASDQAREYRERLKVAALLLGRTSMVHEAMRAAYVAGMEAVAEVVGCLPEQIAQEAPDAE